MAANPNSELVFDFPDPTPRFDFDQSASTTASPKKRTSLRRGKRFGRFSKSKSAAISSAASSAKCASPEKSVDTSHDTATTAEESWVESLTSEEDSRNAGTGNGNHLRSSSPAGSRGSAHSTPQRAWLSSKIGRSSPCSLDVSKHSGTSGSSAGAAAVERLILPSPKAGSRQKNHHKRSASGGAKSAASGYFSEATDMSEFSFDRVTVTTHETSTGKNSSVNWDFISDGALDQMGLSTKDFTPYVGRAGSGQGQGQPPPPACPHPYHAGNSNAANGTSSHHDAVSLSSCSENDIPMSGIVSGSSDSVISEISEDVHNIGRSAAFHEESDAVRRLLEGAEPHVGGEEDGKGRPTSPGARITVTSGGTVAAAKESAVGGAGDGNGNFPDIMSIASTTADHANGLLDKLTSSYRRYKSSRSGNVAAEKTMLGSIAEDIQFCGIWLCGNDTTLAHEGGDADGKGCGKHDGSGRDGLLGMEIGCDPASCLDLPVNEEKIDV